MSRVRTMGHFLLCAKSWARPVAAPSLVDCWDADGRHLGVVVESKVSEVPPPSVIVIVVLYAPACQEIGIWRHGIPYRIRTYESPAFR